LFSDGSCYLIQSLFNKVQTLLTDEERVKAQSLINQINQIGGSQRSEIESLRKQLDPILARENPVTSSRFIDSIKKSFTLVDNDSWML